MSVTTGKYWALLAAVGALQAGFLSKIVYDRVSLIAHGREIALKVIPVDPRDVFRGEYVILGYDISRVPVSAGGTSPPSDLSRGQTIYTTLQQGADGIWTAKALSLNYPADVKPSDVVLKGFVSNRFSPAAGSTPGQDETVSIRYGIESYFVPEGTGRALEASVRDKKIEALVAVDADGTAALKGLIIGGERHEDPPML